MKCLSQVLDNVNSIYENTILIGDIIAEPNEANVSDFINIIQHQKSCQAKNLSQESRKIFLY